MQIRLDLAPARFEKLKSGTPLVSFFVTFFYCQVLSPSSVKYKLLDVLAVHVVKHDCSLLLFSLFSIDVFVLVMFHDDIALCVYICNYLLFTCRLDVIFVWIVTLTRTCSWQMFHTFDSSQHGENILSLSHLKWHVIIWCDLPTWILINYRKEWFVWLVTD